MRGYLARGVKK